MNRHITFKLIGQLRTTRTNVNKRANCNITAPTSLSNGELSTMIIPVLNSYVKGHIAQTVYHFALIFKLMKNEHTIGPYSSGACLTIGK